MKGRKLVPAVLALSMTLSLSGCAGMSNTQQRVLTGGTGGAAAGAVIGAIAGNAGLGAGIGAATGLIGGYLYDRHKESEESAYRRGRREGAEGYR